MHMQENKLFENVLLVFLSRKCLWGRVCLYWLQKLRRLSWTINCCKTGNKESRATE